MRTTRALVATTLLASALAVLAPVGSASAVEAARATPAVAPLAAGVGGCSSLAIDGPNRQYIVGSCTANKPGPNATIRLAFRCIGDRNGTTRPATIVVGWGSSFRYDSKCWFGLADVQRVG